MTKTNSILLTILIAAVLLVGGGIIYSLNKSEGSDSPTGADKTSQTGDQSTEQGDDSADQQTDEASTPNNLKSQVIDGVAIPSTVLTDIERKYPDYIIDDADREVRGGEVYYEIELDHRTPGNDSEYELTYNESWELISTNFDRD